LRKQYIICAGAAALFFLLGLLFLNHVSVGFFMDDVMYVGLGDELVSHFQYRIPCFPSNPLCGKYPPLYPLLLGLLSLLFPSLPAGLLFLKAAGLALAVPGIFFFALWVFKRFASENIHWSLTYLTILIAAIHADLLFMSKELMSESLFMSLVMFGLWKVDSISRSSNENGPIRRSLIWLFLIGILMFYTRSIGIIFIISLFVYMIYIRQFKLLLVLGPVAAVIMFPWFWWSRYYVPAHEPMAGVMPYFVSYGYHMDAMRDFFFKGSGDLPGKILWYTKVNFVATLHSIESMLFPSDVSHSKLFTLTSLRVSSFFAVVFVCIGIFRSFRRGEYMSFFITGYLLLVTAWPWSNKFRFMVPIAPILIFYFLEGIMVLFSRNKRLRNIMLVLLCTVILLSNLLWTFRMNVLPSTLFVRTFGSESKNSVHKDALLQSINWVKENVPKDAIMLVSDGGLAYYVHTGRQILPYRTLISSPVEDLQNMYDAATPKKHITLTSSAVKRINSLFPGRRLYQLDILSKKYLANPEALSDLAEGVFTDNEKDGKVIIIRKLPLPTPMSLN